MKRFLVKTGLGILFLLLPQAAAPVAACSCLPRPAPYVAFRQATAVFVGRVAGSKDVTSQEQVGDKTYAVRERHFIFKVEEAFKGINGPEVELTVGRIDSSCYGGFDLGESYLIYAYGQPGKMLGTGPCTRGGSVAFAKDDIYYIRALLKGLPEPRVYGAVYRAENDLSKSRSAAIVPLEGIKVIVEGEGRRFEAVTDSQGLYSLYNVPDGQYKAHPVLPDKYTGNWPEEEEFILGSQEQTTGYRDLQQGDSAYASFSVGWNNGISGRLLDAEGNIIKRAKSALLLARPELARPLVIEEDEFDYHKEGKYRFYGLTPGKYFLALTIRAPFKSKNMLTRFYYPSATSLSQSSEIEVSESGDLTDRDIRLPPDYLVRPVEGEVVWSDGTPVAEAWVFLAESERSQDDDKKYDWDTVDAQGRFSLQAFVGAEYWLHASIDTGKMKTAAGQELESKGVRELKARPVKVTVGKVNEPLRLVIQLPEGAPKRTK